MRRPPPDKTIVEHTAINPNKAAHIGHLRNAALGDTLVRVARVPRHAGRSAELHRRHRRPGRRRHRRLPRARAPHRSTRSGTIADTTRFDYYCWDLYSRVTEWYAGDKDRLAIRAAALHDLEQRRRTRPPTIGALHRRPHRARASDDDGAAEHRLRPADVRGRHPAAAVLGACVRDSEGAGRGVPADRGQARRLLGDAHRRGTSDRRRERRHVERPNAERRTRARKGARER